jgi:tetratricopeptide (TPR) repeat protein
MRKIGVCVALALGTALLYLPALRFDFINYDDPIYVLGNIHIRTLNWQFLGWCFQPGYGNLWHPLTWMSHALDYWLFGLGRPAGHHATSALLHIFTAIMLFLVLNRMTGALWRSAIVAALFAWHPLHVESVAWISERKDVLSALFWMLTIWAYVRYVEEFKIHNSKSKFFYGLALFFFALGLMSKPMLVTLPFVLLLLDWWPLGRLKFGPPLPNPNLKLNPTSGPGSDEGFRRRDAGGCGRDDRAPENAPGISRLLMEKVPFLVLSAIACVMTLQAAGQLVEPLARFSLKARLINALLTYFRFVEKMIWPADMVAVYPMDSRWSPVEVTLAALTLLVITVCAVRLWKARPFWLAGWLMYLGIMVPVIGLVWVGAQPMADHYTYLSSIGLFMIICWEGWDLASGWQHGRAIAGAAAAVALAACFAVSCRQLQYWKNSATLHLHTLEVFPNSPSAHADYAAYLRDYRDFKDARDECNKALRLDANYAFAHDVLGGVLMLQGSYDEADSELRTALRLDPRRVDVHLPLGMVALARNQPQEAAAQFTAFLKTDPSNTRAYLGLAAAYSAVGDNDRAVATAWRAHELAVAQDDTNAVAKSLDLLSGFGAHQP